MELTNNQKKIDLVAKLLKEGAIDFNEAIELLQENKEKEYIYYPINQPVTIWPYTWPYSDTVTIDYNVCDTVVTYDATAAEIFWGAKIGTV